MGTMASMGDTIFTIMIILIVIIAAIIILILALALSGGRQSESEVQSSNRSPVANLDEDIVLSCFLRSRLSGDVSVTWTKKGLSGLVYSYQRGKAVLKDQNSEFRDRTQLFPDAIASGNVSLLLRRVRQSDQGVYSCEVNANGTVDVDLRVAAFSAPSFTYASDVLTATSLRWLPKPNVTWLDLDGKVLNGTTTFSNTSAGIFSLVSTLRPVSQNSTHTCRIQNNLVRAVAEATITDKGVSTRNFFTYSAAASPTATFRHLSLITCFLLSSDI